MGRKYKIHDDGYFYFITFTIVEWLDVFSKEEYRDIFIDSVSYCQREKGLLVGAWCIMTNHVHMIISTEQKDTLTDIIRDLKSYTSRQIRKHLEYSKSENRSKWILSILKEAGQKNSRNKDFQFWQQHNHPIQLDSNEMTESRLNYIHQNPVKAGFVDEGFHWKYSSARDYAEEQGLLEIYFLD